MRSALFHFLWQGAAVAALLAFALCYVRSATKRYALACAALLALPIAFAVTFALQQPAPEPIVRFAVWPPPQLEPLAVSTGTAPRTPFDPVAAWFLGMSLVYAYRVFGWASAQWLRRTGVCAAPSAWQHRLAALAQCIRLTRTVTLLESAIAETPVTIGTFRPVILFPIGLLTGLPAEHIEAILLHELAHIRRHDYLVNLAQSAIEGLLFYHPATWWISHIIRREREHCCDDLAASAAGALTYTQALTALAEHRVQTPILAASGGLMSRVHRLLYPNHRTTSPIPAALFLTLATTAALFAFKPLPKPQAAPAPPQTPAQPAAAERHTPPAASPQRPRSATATTLLAQANPPAAPPQPQTPPSETQQLEAQLRAILELSHEKWLNEEVVWIITPEERAAFNRLDTYQEHQKFIEQFWLRRDPTPDTAANEFREEHYRRIAWANDHFPATRTAGWKTDRGMIYIKFGPPDEKEEHFAAGDALASERWRYRILEGVGRNVIIEFVDRNRDNAFPMTTDPAQNNALFPAPEPVKAASRDYPPNFGTPRKRPTQ